MNVPVKKYAAELLGTFALALAVLMAVVASLKGNVIPIPVVAAITLGLFVYTVGHISGTHLNPAITIGAFSINKISLQDTIGYLVAQFVGAGLAILVAMGFTSELATVLQPVVMNLQGTLATGLAEAIGMFFFAFGVASVIYGRTNKSMSGVVVGLSLVLGIMFAIMLGSIGVLNPAVGMAIKAFNVMYIVGPLVGSVAGMWAYKLLSEDCGDCMKKSDETKSESMDTIADAAM